MKQNALAQTLAKPYKAQGRVSVEGEAQGAAASAYFCAFATAPFCPNLPLPIYDECSNRKNQELLDFYGLKDAALKDADRNICYGRFVC